MATNPREIGDLTLSIAQETLRQRTRRRWEQQELASRSGIPQGTLSRIERGRVAIDTEQIERIAIAFGMIAETFTASARKNYGTPLTSEGAQDEAYLPDGRLDPTNTRGLPPTDQHLDNLTSRRRAGGE